MPETPLTLQTDDPVAAALRSALDASASDQLERLLADEPRLARCFVVNSDGGGRSPLHLFADWPGHRPNAAAIVGTLAAAGADLDAPAVGMWHREAPLHWAASNDDVALIDALLDAGADLEHVGSSIDGGPPLSSAVGYGQWKAAARLVERGARTQLWHEAGLGLTDAVKRRFETAAPTAAERSSAFWNACHGGRLEVAQYLLSQGADLNWAAPWSGQTPLDIAEKAGWTEVSAWLSGMGAMRGETRA